MLVTYIIGSLALIIKPGPDLTCTIATALSDGKARAATLMAGLIIGCWLWILVLAAGVASVFTHHPAVMLSIQLVGTAYIAYLAFGAVKEAWTSFRSAETDALRGATARGWRLVGRGILMSMSNPLTILFFLAFLPHCQKGSDPSVYALLYMLNLCSRQNLASLAQKPVALQRRLGLLRQCLRDVPLLHQRIQVRCRKPGLT